MYSIRYVRSNWPIEIIQGVNCVMLRRKWTEVGEYDHYYCRYVLNILKLLALFYSKQKRTEMQRPADLWNSFHWPYCKFLPWHLLFHFYIILDNLQQNVIESCYCYVPIAGSVGELHMNCKGFHIAGVKKYFGGNKDWVKKQSKRT